MGLHTSCKQVCLVSSASVSATPGPPVLANGNAVFKDYISKQKILCLAITCPVHQHCLEQERLQNARALIKIRQWVQPQYALALRVDEVLCRIPCAEQYRFKEQIEAITYSEV